MRIAPPPAIDVTARAVGARVQAEMKRQSIRQSAVAKRLRMSQAAVSRRMTGVIPFNVAELEKLSRLLDVPASAFLTEAAELEPVSS